MIKWLEAPLQLMGLVTFDAAGMKESPMSSGADVDELVVVVTVECDVAATKASLIPSGGNGRTGTRSTCRTQ